MNLRRENHENPCTNRANRDRHWRRGEEEEKATHLDLQVEGSLFSFFPSRETRERKESGCCSSTSCCRSFRCLQSGSKTRKSCPSHLLLVRSLFLLISSDISLPCCLIWASLFGCRDREEESTTRDQRRSKLRKKEEREKKSIQEKV